jgi:hypothetical protein
MLLFLSLLLLVVMEGVTMRCFVTEIEHRRRLVSSLLTIEQTLPRVVFEIIADYSALAIIDS